MWSDDTTGGREERDNRRKGVREEGQQKARKVT
jgi:hypothetical protein